MTLLETTPMVFRHSFRFNKPLAVAEQIFVMKLPSIIHLQKTRKNMGSVLWELQQAEIHDTKINLNYANWHFTSMVNIIGKSSYVILTIFAALWA